MKVGIVAFFLGLASIHMSGADSFEADHELSECPSSLPPPEEVEEIPDGIIFTHGGEFAIYAHCMREIESLLKYIAKHIVDITTEKDRHFDQCIKFGEHIICITLSIFDTDQITKHPSALSEKTFYDYNPEDSPRDDNEDDNGNVGDAEERAEDKEEEVEAIQDEKVEEKD